MPKLNLDPTNMLGSAKTASVLAALETGNPQQIRKVTTDHPVQELPVESIFISPLQYRKWVNQAEVDQIALSIRHEEFNPVVIVREAAAEPNRYELAVGQKRFLATKQAGKSTILAIVREMTDDEMIGLALKENNQRSKPSVIEQTLGVMQQLCLRLNCSEAEIRALLNRNATKKKKGSYIDVRTDEKWQILEQTIQEGAEVTPEAFRVHRLLLLNLPEDLKQKMGEGVLEPSKAQIIGRVEDPQERQALLNEVLEKGLSQREINARVRQLQVDQTPGDSNQVELAPRDRLTQISRQSKKSKAWDDPRKARKIQSLLERLEALLGEV